MKAFAKAKQKLIENFGRIYESRPFDYWHQFEYIGPFSKDPDGKFIIRAPMEKIIEYRERLKPYIRNNNIIAMKHLLRENQPSEPEYGKDPIMLVSARKKHRKSVEEILKKENIQDPEWTEENAVIEGLEYEKKRNEIEKQKGMEKAKQ